MLTETDVHRAYREVLLRAADPSALHHFVGNAMTSASLERQIEASAEYRANIAPIIADIQAWSGRRILLFGAYGNGNMGDDIQADAVARLLTDAVPSSRCWSTSCFSRGYPCEWQTALPRGAIFSNRLLKQFDVLVIGGGGLLAHPHEPLADEAWVRSLPIPHILLGVGADETFTDPCALLLSRASFVGGRDVRSVSWLARYNPNVGLVPDPVLADEALPSFEARDGGPTCWILKQPIEASPFPIDRLIAPDDRVLAMEPHLDAVLLRQFPQLELVSSAEILLKRMHECRRVVSMRYHGVVFGLKVGLPTFSLGVRKGDELLTLLGLPGNAIENASDLAREGGVVRRPTLQAMRVLFQTQSAAWIAAVTDKKRDLTMKPALAPEIVEIAYRGLLGRPPESAGVVERHCRAHASAEDFLRALVCSPEYVAKNIPRRRDYNALSRVDTVESEVDDATLSNILDHTRQVWTRYGRDDPFYSVLTHPKFAKASIDGDAIKEFYESGKTGFNLLSSVLKDHGKSFEQAKVVDFGCGVGRIGIHVAGEASRYLGVDISAPHLVQAQEKFEQIGRQNGEFVLLEDYLSAKSEADIIFSLIVLQHNPPPIIQFLVAELCKKLSPGGVIVFQVPTTLTGYRFQAGEYIKGMSEATKMEMHALPTPKVLDVLRRNGCVPLDMFEYDMIGPIGISTIFVAEKSA